MTDREGREQLAAIMENAVCMDPYSCPFGMYGQSEDGMEGCFARYEHGNPNEEDRGCIAHQVGKVLRQANELINQMEAEDPEVFKDE